MNRSGAANHERGSSFTLDFLFTGTGFALLLGMLIIAWFPEVVLGTRSFVFRDFGFYGYPVAKYFRECFWRGELPLWNPYNNCGVPFLAQWSTLVCYLGSLFYLLFPLPWSLNAFCLLHLFLGGMGMYFFARRLTNNNVAGAIAGLAYTFNGLTFSCLIWPHYMVCLGWLPFVFLSVERALRQGRRWVVIAAFCGTMQMMSGMPEFILITWLMIGTWFLMTMSREGNVRGRIVRFAMIIFIIVGLSAIQLLPFLEFLQQSNRSENYSVSGWSMPATGLANFFVPLFHCEKLASGIFMQKKQGLFSSYYQSLPIVLLSLVALIRVRNWRVVLLGIFVLVALLFGFGENGFVLPLVKRLVPGMALIRYPIKFILPIAFALPLLAAFGWVELCCDNSEKPKDKSRRLIGILAAVMSLVIVCVLLYDAVAGHSFDSLLLQNAVTRLVILLTSVFIVYRLCRDQRKGGSSSRLVPVALLLVWIDVITHTPNQNPTVPPIVFNTPLAKIDSSVKHPELGQGRAMLLLDAWDSTRKTSLADPANNFISKRVALAANCNLLDDVPKVDGFFSLYLRESSELERYFYESDTAVRTNLADLLNVTETTVPGKPFEWTTRSSAIPFVSLGGQPLYMPEKETLNAVISPNFNPHVNVVLPEAARTQQNIVGNSDAIVRSAKITPHKVSAQVHLTSPGVLSISQNWYHSWKAFVDGQPVPLWKANHSLQALYVPAGEHKVEVTYRDWAFRIGATVSAATLLGCLVSLYVMRGERRDLTPTQ